MQIDETVHGCPVAVVHLIVRVEILALQVKSAPPRDSRLWLRPQAALWKAARRTGTGGRAGRPSTRPNLTKAHLLGRVKAMAKKYIIIFVEYIKIIFR